MIDDTWQETTESGIFICRRFPQPKQMVDELPQNGFQGDALDLPFY